MTLPSDAFVQQQAIHAKCFHPSGVWEEFPQSALESSIVARFEEMVARYPARIAAKSRNWVLTYTELNRAADVLTQQLRDLLPDRQQPIAICCQHDVPVLVAVLGVLKAGHFYACLDPHGPLIFNQQIVEEIIPVCLLTDHTTAPSATQLARPGLSCVNIEAFDWQAASSRTTPSVAMPTDLAYITFTSGSTGSPKGVMEDHQDVLYYTSLFVNYFHLSPSDRTLAVTRINTGGAWVSIFPALLSGGSVFLFDVEKEGAAALAQWIGTEQITVMAMAVALFRALAPALPAKRELAALRLLGLGGETIHATDIQLYRTHCPDHTLLRFAFGCTEAHFISWYFMDKMSSLPNGPTPVGYAAGDAEILILDEAGNHVKQGDIGEIAVRRTHFSVGYWRNPTLTAMRYATDAKQPNKRIYRLGDRGYQQEDGCLVHLGRVDNQVKVRGHLVDLDAFEQTLSQLDEVEQAAAIVSRTDDGNARLIAYLQTRPGSQATVSFYYQRLVHRLPGYLLPQAIVLVDQMPLTPSGKIDRHLLPAPTTHRPALSTPYRAPSTQLEKRLVALWQEVLHIDPIGVDDHFLEVGGDSLRAMMIMNQIQRITADFVYVSLLFEAPTIAAFSALLIHHYPTTARNLAGMSTSAPALAVEPKLLPSARLDSTTVQAIRTWLSSFKRQSAGVVEARQSPDTKNPTACFVLSSPRSGSTLLRILLAGHPQLFAPPELVLLQFGTLQERRDMLSRPGAGERDGAIRAIMAAKNYGGEAAQSLMEQLEIENLTTQAFYRQLQSWIDPRQLVDKSPSYTYAVETLRQAEAEFDAPRYLHLVRHPYGMIRSYIKNQSHLRLLSRLRHHSPDSPPAFLTEKSPFPAELIAEAIWVITQQNVNTFFATVPPERRLLIHFEELVRQPKIVLTRVCNFLKIPFQPAMLQPYADPNSRMTNGVNALSLMVGDTKFNTYTQIEPSVADRWRAEHTTDFLSDLTWELAESLGYRRADLPLRLQQPGAALHTTGDLAQLITQIETLSDAETARLLCQHESL